MNFIKCRIPIILIAMIVFLSNINSCYSEKIKINDDLKIKILNSSLKANLMTKDGRKITAYLYAEDEKQEIINTKSCTTGEIESKHSVIGHYFIYLYDYENKIFSPERIEALYIRGKIRFNVDGSGLLMLQGSKGKESDVLHISQFVECDGNYYGAYGFSDNNFRLENYWFRYSLNNTQELFYGHIFFKNSKLYAFRSIIEAEGVRMGPRLLISDKDSEIKLDSIDAVYLKEL